MQRRAVILSAYNYSIIYKQGPDLVEADTLSRLQITDVFSPEDGVYFIAPFPAVPMTAKERMSETRKDPTLANALDITQHGFWPGSMDESHLKS